MGILDEAIIEANQLREAAKLQAKNDIINKYSDEIRNRMDSLLNESILDEAPEDGLDLGLEDDLGEEEDMGLEGDGLEFEDDLEITDDNFGMDDGGSVDTEYIDDQIPMGFVNDDEEIEIDFDELVDMIDDSTSADMLDREETAEEVVGVGEDGMQVQDDEYEADMDDDLEGILEELERELEDEDEMVLTDQEDCDDDLYQEGHKADMRGVAKGWSPRPQSELEREMARNEVAKEYDSVFDTEDEETVTSTVKDSKNAEKANKSEKNKMKTKTFKDLDPEALVKENKEKSESINRLLKENNIIKGKNRLLYERLVEAKEVLDMIILDNDKKRLQVEVFKNDRLNGRQKERIVEALEKAKTLNEAQSIFELQNVTASRKEDKNPAREAINNLPRNQTRIKGVIREQVETDPVADQEKNRWQQIAGIKKS